MFGSDDAPLVESMIDMGFARGAINAKSDDRFVRGRVAMLLWLPSLIGMVMLAVWLQAPLLLAVGIPVLLVGLWVYAERREQVAAFVRRRIGK